jgi:hypothetical protein
MLECRTSGSIWLPLHHRHAYLVMGLPLGFEADMCYWPTCVWQGDWICAWWRLDLNHFIHSSR